MTALGGAETAHDRFSLPPPGYDAAVGPLFRPDRLQRAAVDRPGIDAGDRVLDVGCGTGRTLDHVREAGGRDTGWT